MKGMISTVDKPETLRRARAESRIEMAPETLECLKKEDLPKKGVLPTARAAGLLAAKRTPDFIPHCHPLGIDSVEIDFEFEEKGVRISVEVSTIAKTGVEMEALTAASVAALTLYDMLKGVDKEMVISSTRLLKKKGGKSQFQVRLPKEFCVAVLVTDDALFDSKKEDKHRSWVLDHLRSLGIENVSYEVCPQDPERIRPRLLDLCEKQVPLVFTIGGTGLDSYDRTAETVEEVMTRPLPGVMETARHFGQRRGPYALLSRGMAGQRGKTVLVALPGSSRGVQESLTAILPGLLHGLAALLRKEGAK